MFAVITALFGSINVAFTQYETTVLTIMNGVGERNSQVKDWSAQFRAKYIIRKPTGEQEIQTQGTIKLKGTTKRRMEEICAGVPEFNRIMVQNGDSSQVLYPLKQLAVQGRNSPLLNDIEKLLLSINKESVVVDKSGSNEHMIKIDFPIDVVGEKVKNVQIEYLEDKKSISKYKLIGEKKNVIAETEYQDFIEKNGIWFASKSVQRAYDDDGDLALVSEMTFQDMSYNTNLEDSLFGIEIPNGYTLIKR